MFFLPLIYVIISLMLLVWLVKLLTSFFFSNCCSKSISFSNGAEGYNLSVSLVHFYRIKYSYMCNYANCSHPSMSRSIYNPKKNGTLICVIIYTLI